ncbi:acyltransferase family protein [Anoxybacillus gonensis]|uniref:acyltransferase family protein n=1 Tax=Anoxybacillus gonensis TaxID=198467 RepID=UPI0002BEE366|nr:hypothetical protein F510_2460 [Anoxybacillus gonensis]
MQRIRYYSIDYVKFFCAIAVVLIHNTTYISIHKLDTLSNYYIYRYFLNIAVPFFFMSSGFFIGQKLLTSKNPNYILEYTKKIFSYLLSFSLFYIFVKTVFILGDWIFKDRPIHSGISDLLQHISFKSILNGSIGSFHLWFLASLIYACMILYAFIQFKVHHTHIFVISVFLYVFASADLVKTPTLFNHGSIVFGLFYVSLGYFISHYKKIHQIKFPLFYMLIFAFLYFLASYKHIGTLTSIFLALWAFYLFVICVKNPNFGENSFITSLSKYALAIYILHIFVRDSIVKIYSYIDFDHFYTWAPHYVYTILLCIVVPMFIYDPIYALIQKIKSQLIFEN